MNQPHSRAIFSIHTLLLTLHLFPYSSSFFFNDPATTEIYTLSLHDALPIFPDSRHESLAAELMPRKSLLFPQPLFDHRLCGNSRSEEHTSELQSLTNLVCRLLLEKKKKRNK